MVHRAEGPISEARGAEFGFDWLTEMRSTCHFAAALNRDLPRSGVRKQFEYWFVIVGGNQRRLPLLLLRSLTGARFLSCGDDGQRGVFFAGRSFHEAGPWA